MAEFDAAEKATKTANPGSKKAAQQADVEAAVREKIAAMPVQFSGIAEQLHALILRSAPGLRPRLWYGMPAYEKDGRTVCFFRADKNCMTFGFTQEAGLTCEEGAPDRLIECAWFLTSMDDATAARLSGIVKKFAR
ncbi:MAG TPA: DUF1801 domain-containing protein [Terracidiphilus sp.]